MPDTSIPNGDGQEIANAKDSDKDTQSQDKENLDNKTTQDSKDSDKDTQQKQEDNIDVNELKSLKSDIEREKFELDKSKSEQDPDYLKKLGEKNPKRANKIASRLSDGQYDNYSDLLTAYEKQKEYSNISDDKVKELMKWKDQQEMEKKKLERQKKEQQWEQAKDKLYKEHPEVSPEQDKDNSKWNKLRQEMSLLNIQKLGYEKALKKAYKLAFDEFDEKESRSYQNSSGVLPSSGGVIEDNSKPKTEQEKIAEKFNNNLPKRFQPKK